MVVKSIYNYTRRFDSRTFQKCTTDTAAFRLYSRAWRANSHCDAQCARGWRVAAVGWCVSTSKFIKSTAQLPSLNPSDRNLIIFMSSFSDMLFFLVLFFFSAGLGVDFRPCR